jgi:hypothetical protein
MRLVLMTQIHKKRTWHRGCCFRRVVYGEGEWVGEWVSECTDSAYPSWRIALMKRVGHPSVPNPVYNKIMVLEALPSSYRENDAVASMVDERERRWVAASDTNACAARYDVYFLRLSDARTILKCPQYTIGKCDVFQRHVRSMRPSRRPPLFLHSSMSCRRVEVFPPNYRTSMPKCAGWNVFCFIIGCKLLSFDTDIPP